MSQTSRVRAVFAVPLAAAALFAASVAHATTLVAKYTGKVDAFTDTHGLFGTPGAVLDGETFVATFTYDPADGRISPGKMDGGPYWGLPPLMTATLAIKGADWTFDEMESRVEVRPDGAVHYISGVSGWMQFFAPVPDPPADYFSELPLFAGSITAWAHLRHDATYYSLALRAETVQITAAVPEPGTWGLMIVGFGLAGAALRRRPRRLAPGG